MPEWSLVLLGIGSTAAIGFFAWIVVTINSLKVDVEANKRQFALIPLAQLIQDQFLKSLHHEEAGFEKTDHLIDQWFDLTITEGGVAALKDDMLHRQSDPRVSPEEHAKAEAVLALMKVVKIQKRMAADKIANRVLSIMMGVSVASIQALRHWR